MEKSKFIYQVETEKHFSSLVRIVTTFGRQRVPIIEMHASVKDGDDRQRFTITVMENKENAVKISKRLEREVDVLSVNLFEQFSTN